MSETSADESSTLTLVAITLFCLAFAVGGVFLYHQQSKAINVSRPTDATVVSSESRSGTDDYVVDITYRYTVDGHTYRSDNVFPGSGDPEKSAYKADRIVDDYPEGATVTAYYNPNKPANSFLIQKRDVLMPLAMTGLGGLVSLSFGAVLVKRVLGFEE